MPQVVQDEVETWRENERVKGEKRRSGNRTVADALKEFRLIRQNTYVHRPRKGWPADRDGDECGGGPPECTCAVTDGIKECDPDSCINAR